MPTAELSRRHATDTIAIGFDTTISLPLTDGRIAAGEHLRQLLEAEPHDRQPTGREAAQLGEQLLERYGPEAMRALGSRVLMAHHVAQRSPHVGDRLSTDSVATRRELQEGTLGHTLGHLASVPADWQPDKPLSGDRLIEAKTGFGKTVIGGLALWAAGVGERSATSLPPIRALVTTPDLDLVDQLMGRTDDTFRRFLGNARVTEFTGKQRDTTGDVIVATNVSAARHLDPHRFDIMYADEGDTTLGPVHSAYIQQARGKIIYATSTPSLSDGRSLRQRAITVETAGYIDLIGAGILNPTELKVFQCPPEHEVQFATNLALQLVQSDRPTVIFCRRGQDQPRQIADSINRLSLPIPLAGAIGDFDNKLSTLHKQRFSDKRLFILTTTGMLNRGWNGGLNGSPLAVILIGPNSLREAEQKAGRASRLGPQHSFIAEINPGDTSILQAYGLRHVVDRVIGLGARAADFTTPAWRPQEAAILKSSDQTARPAPSDSTPSSRATALPLLPNLQVHQVPVGTAVEDYLITPETLSQIEPPPGYIRLSELAERYNNPPLTLLRRTLDGQNIPYEGIWPDGAYERCYDEAAAIAYLDTNPIPDRATERHDTRAAIATRLGVTNDYLQNIIDRLELVGTTLTSPQNRDEIYYSADQEQLMKSELDKIPIADIDDVTQGSLCASYGKTFVLLRVKKFGITPIFKRSHPAHQPKGFFNYVTVADADIIIKAYDNLPFADPTDKNVSDIARAAGVDQNSVNSSLTPAERALMAFKRRKTGNTSTYYLTAEQATPIIERLRPARLPLQVVPRIMIPEIIAVSPNQIKKRLGAVAPLPFRPPGRVTIHAYPWSSLEPLVAEFGLQAGAPSIDFGSLPQSIDDDDPSRLTAAWNILRIFVDPTLLAQPPGGVRISKELSPEIADIPETSWHRPSDAMTLLRATPLAFLLLNPSSRDRGREIRREGGVVTNIKGSLVKRLMIFCHHLPAAHPEGMMDGAALLEATAGNKAVINEILGARGRSICRSAAGGVDVWIPRDIAYSILERHQAK